MYFSYFVIPCVKACPDNGFKMVAMSKVVVSTLCQSSIHTVRVYPYCADFLLNSGVSYSNNIVIMVRFSFLVLSETVYYWQYIQHIRVADVNCSINRLRLKINQNQNLENGKALDFRKSEIVHRNDWYVILIIFLVLETFEVSNLKQLSTQISFVTI